MDIDAQTVLEAIKSYKTQIIEMDGKVSRYLSDRQKYPHPQYDDLVNEVRRFENRIYRINFGFSNTEVHLRLDGLLHSLLIYERSWQRLFDRDAEKYEKMKAEGSAAEPGPPAQAESNPFVDKVFAYAQKKWSQSGIDGKESKEALARRLLPAYKEARKKLKKGEKISVGFDPESNQVKLTIKQVS